MIQFLYMLKVHDGGINHTTNQFIQSYAKNRV